MPQDSPRKLTDDVLATIPKFLAMTMKTAWNFRVTLPIGYGALVQTLAS